MITSSGTLKGGSPFTLVKGFLHIPLYKPGEYLEGINELGNHVLFKINKDPARRQISKKGTYSYKIIYQLEYLDGIDIKDSFINPSILILNNSFLSFLGLYLLTSSNQGNRRSRIMVIYPDNEDIYKGYIEDLSTKVELFPIYKDNRDLGIPKLRIDLDMDNSIQDIFSILTRVKDFLSFAFFREDISLGEVIILENDKPILKIIYPPLTREDPGPNRDESTSIPYRYLVNRYKDNLNLGIKIPPNKGRRMIISKPEGEEDIRSFYALYEVVFNKKVDNLEAAVKEVSIKLSLNPKIEVEIEGDLDNPNDFTKLYRKIRILNLRLSLYLLGLTIEEIDDSIARVFR